jgi:hypothetical protein
VKLWACQPWPAVTALVTHRPVADAHDPAQTATEAEQTRGNRCRSVQGRALRSMRSQVRILPGALTEGPAPQPRCRSFVSPAWSRYPASAASRLGAGRDVGGKSPAGRSRAARRPRPLPLPLGGRPRANWGDVIHDPELGDHGGHAWAWAAGAVRRASDGEDLGDRPCGGAGPGRGRCGLSVDAWTIADLNQQPLSTPDENCIELALENCALEGVTRPQFVGTSRRLLRRRALRSGRSARCLLGAGCPCRPPASLPGQAPDFPTGQASHDCSHERSQIMRRKRLQFSRKPHAKQHQKSEGKEDPYSPSPRWLRPEKPKDSGNDEIESKEHRCAH